MTNLTILNNSIRSYGNLYSLNDLHQAGGGLNKHSPFRFMRNESTQEIISEMKNEMNTKSGVQKEAQGSDLIFKTLRGRNIQGTWVCEELMLAYAMWISPKFHLIVLRAFLNLHKKSTALLPNTITPEQQQAIQSAVQQAHHRTGLSYAEIYRQIKSIFKVAKYDQLPQDQFGNAIAFIVNLQPIALPPVEKKFTFEFTEYELQQLAWLWFAFKRGVGTFQHIEKAFNVLGSNMSGQIYGQAYEYLSVLRSTNQILNRITSDFDIDQMTNWRVLQHLRDFNPKAVKINF
ncbi:P22AR C-terminal domain-containing protein [Hoylesella nanceiensis]|uniref:P22AR C-terminal domain-containing protein n=1 Tax=Hoylesella nanceiensis TaxID=425941 RepID=UPI0024A920D0|nr:P22AR C-terminal domain-containing protein [Hoylesella nanceiensis]